MHRTPVVDENRAVVGMRYFSTVTACKTFAKEQARRLGRAGYTLESLPANVVAGLLEAHAPTPTHYAPAPRDPEEKQP